MRLSEEHSRQLLRTRGVYVTQVCDRCGTILGPVRFTRQGEGGAWCSRACRDGADHKPGLCRGCGVSLAGKRKHARFCSDVCRKRQRVRDLPRNPETPIADKGLTDATSRSGCGGSQTGILTP
jgi:hypothetical protein